MDHPLVKQVQQNLERAKEIKSQIKDIKARQMALSSQPVAHSGNNLRANLASILPGHLVPGNVGHVNHAQWPFYYQIDFDLTTTPDWPNLTANTRLVESFQVTQESAFIFYAVSRHADDYNDAGDLGPLTVEFRDRQSSRFFNQFPIPIQMIGQKSYPTVMPTPFIVMPNGVMEVTLKTHLAPGVSQNTPGGSTGKHQFTFMGYRIRVEDAHKVLSTIFG